MKQSLFFLLFLILFSNAQQNIGTGINLPRPSSCLDLVFFNNIGGLTQIKNTLNISNLTTECLIYHTLNSTFRYFDEIVWRKIFATGISELNPLEDNTNIDSAILSRFILQIFKDQTVTWFNFQPIIRSIIQKGEISTLKRR